MSDAASHPTQVGGGEVFLAAADLVHALRALRQEVEGSSFPLRTLSAAAAQAERRRSLDQLDDYLIPRLESQGAPLLVVVGGSTGAGKSTLVNSVLGEHVTTPGALRPTTRSPVLAHHPDDARWFTSDRIFPHLARETVLQDESDSAGAATTSATSHVSPARRPEPSSPEESGQALDGRSLRLVATDALPLGLALLDAPDVDSVVVGNRELAAQLLAAADLWLFVTTAARYADAVPWALLHEGAARRAQVAVVVDRVDPGAEVVADDLRRMLAENGLGLAPVFVVPELSLVDGMLPERAVAPISRWLTDLGADAGSREAVIAATRDGVVDDLTGRVLALAEAADAQQTACAALARTAVQAYDHAAFEVSRVTSDGSMLRGEVLARWQDFVGTGDFMRGVEEKIGVLRDKVTGFFRGRQAPVPKVAVAITHNLEAIVLDAADSAAEQVYLTWQDDPAGAGLGLPIDLSRASHALRADLAEQIRGWQGDVLALVTDRGADKRGRARVLAIGVNGVGAALMIVVFASTGGLTGTEVGIAGGSVLLAQRLLEGVFGDDAVRALAREAHALLDARVQTLLGHDARRFTDLLDDVDVSAEAGARLRAAAYTVERAAAAEQAARGGSPQPFDLAAPEGVAGSAGRGRLRGADLVLDAVPPASSSAVDVVGARRPGFFARLRRRPRAEDQAQPQARPEDWRR